MSVNIIIGGGIFAGPQSMTLISGSSSFIAWPLAALIIFPIVWGIAHASILFPDSGGFYNYCKNGLSENFGFLAHWLYLLGYTMGTSSTITILLRDGIADKLGIIFFLQHPFIANALILAFFSLLNLLSLNVISKIQVFATVLKLIPIIMVILLTICNSHYDIRYDFVDIKKIHLTIPTVIFGYLGFESCCSLSHLLKEGPKSVGKVMLTAFFITTILYMIFHFGLLQIMGATNLSANGAIAFANYLNFSLSTLLVINIIIIGSVLLCYANSLFGILLGNITNIIALSNLGKVETAIVHGIVVWVLLCFMNNIQTLFAFTVLGVGAAYFLTLLAVANVSLSRKEYKNVIISFLGFVSCFILFYCCWSNLGGNKTDRMVSLIPLVIMTTVGFLSYKLNLIKIRQN